MEWAPILMRENGLQEAIKAAGGVGVIARALGIRQPSVSSWIRVPANRVLAVEALTGVSRAKLRPDLYTSEPMPCADIDELELARASEYLLIAKLLRQAPTADLLGQISQMKGDVSPLGIAHMQLADAARASSVSDVGSEFFSLFIGIGRGEVLPYASYYLTGFLHEKPLAKLREDLAAFGLERAEGNFDPEDHLGLLLEVMGGFSDRTFAAEFEQQKSFFGKHIAPWAERCFADIAVAENAKFYKALARLGETFIALEREAFEIGL